MIIKHVNVLSVRQYARVGSVVLPQKTINCNAETLYANMEEIWGTVFAAVAY